MAAERSRASLPVLFSVVVVDLIGFGIVIPVLPFLAETYGASATVLGALLTSYAVMQALFAPIWGRVSDRFGRRPVMLATIAGSSLALLLLGLADSLVGLFVARTLGGIFGANISVATAYVTDVTSEEQRTTWMGMIGASFGVGFILGPAIGGLLAPYGYAVPMLAASGLSAANLIYAAIVLREPQRHREREAAGVGPARLLRNGFVRRICLGYFAFTLGVTQLETVFAFFMMDRFGYDAREVAYILVLMALIMVAIQGGGLRALAPRYGERNLILGGASLLALCFAVVPFVPSVALLLVPLSISSIGRGISQPAMMSIVSQTATPTTRGAVMGTFQSSASLARVVGPVIAGLLYDVSLASPFILASVLMAAVFAIAAALPAPDVVQLDDLEAALD
jgi:DHA1 family tetracycline resistance protein-like MFS transporter